MIRLLYYLLISGATLALGTLLGRLFFRRITWYRATRIYYLTLLLSAWLLPIIGIALPHIEWSDLWSSPSDPLVLVSTGALEVGVTETPPTTDLLSLWLPRSLCIVWLIGVGAMIVRFVKALVQLYKIRRRSTRYTTDDHKKVYLLPEGMNAFSAFGAIYIPQALLHTDEWEMIYTHEVQHTAGRHYIDVLLSELSLIISWWNPFVWQLRREIDLNLEHLADRGVLDQGFNSKLYQYKLLNHSVEDEPLSPLYSSYNTFHHLKERIIMMNKQASNKCAILRLWIVLPLAVVALFGGNYLLSQPATASQVQPGEVSQSEEPPFEVCEKMPEFPGGINEMLSWIVGELHYPEDVQDNVQGTVIVQFVVEKDGSVSNAEIIRGIHPRFDEEALRVVQAMPRWTPGENKGEKVRVRFSLPIKFSSVSASTKTDSKGPQTGDTTKKKYLYVMNGDVISEEQAVAIDPDKIESIRVEKSQSKANIQGKEYDLKAMNLKGITYIVLK